MLKHTLFFRGNGRNWVYVKRSLPEALLLFVFERKKEYLLTIKTGGHKFSPLNEKTLFHGTSPDAVEAICKQNFDWRLNGKNATVYGEGSYFAVNASYSDAYAKKDANSSQFIFLVKVLVGTYTKGDSSYRRPPPKQPSNPSSDLYDSCVDDEYNPTIFVVFDTDQFYPEYIIEYSDEARGAGPQTGAYAVPSYSRAAPSTSSFNTTSGYYSSSSVASSSYGSASNSSSSTPYRSTGTSYYSGTASSHNTTYSSHISSTGTSRNYSSSTNTSNVSHHSSTPSSSSKSSKENKCLVM